MARKRPRDANQYSLDFTSKTDERWRLLRALELDKSEANCVLRYFLETVHGIAGAGWLQWSHGQLSDRLSLPVGSVRRLVARAKGLGLVDVEPAQRGDGSQAANRIRINFEAIRARASRSARDENVTTRDETAPPRDATPDPWHALAAELAGLQLGKAQTALAAARANGVAPETVAAIVDVWKQKPRRWGVPALGWRIAEATPGDDPEARWPAPRVSRTRSSIVVDDNRRNHLQAVAAMHADDPDDVRLRRYGAELEQLGLSKGKQ